MILLKNQRAIKKSKDNSGNFFVTILDINHYQLVFTYNVVMIFNIWLSKYKMVLGKA